MSVSDAMKKEREYSGSPTPFAFFLALFMVFLALAIVSFQHPALSVLFVIVAFTSAGFLPATVAINKAGSHDEG